MILTNNGTFVLDIDRCFEEVDERFIPLPPREPRPVEKDDDLVETEGENMLRTGSLR